MPEVNSNAVDSNDDRDIMTGGVEIAEFCTELLNREINAKQVYNWIANKTIPAGKLGKRSIIASKQAIRDRVITLAGGI